MMSNFLLYGNENTELAAIEAVHRGYRQMYVLIDDKVFELNVYDIVRLQQDSEIEVKSAGFFGIEPNIILVERVDMYHINLTVENLIQQGFFENLKYLEKEAIEAYSLLS